MIILDFETNQMIPLDVLEVSALKVLKKGNAYEIVDIFHRYYFSKYETNLYSLEIHKLDFETITKLRANCIYSKYFEDDFDFINFCENSSTLIAHNISFELFFLKKPVLFENLFCTMKENKYIVKSLNTKGKIKNPKLIEVCEYYNLSFDNDKYHSAKYDTEMTLQVLNSMNNADNNYDIIHHTFSSKILTKIEDNFFCNNRFKQNIQTRQHETKIFQSQHEWLDKISCPYCDGKNIHKKDKRQRIAKLVQRYQCKDCIKIFQIEIQDNDKQ